MTVPVFVVVLVFLGVAGNTLGQVLWGATISRKHRKRSFGISIGIAAGAVLIIFGVFWVAPASIKISGGLLGAMMMVLMCAFAVSRRYFARSK